MTAPRDPDRLIHDFLFEGEEQLQDQVYDAVRAEIEQKRQRAGFGLWRTPTMNKFLAFGLGAAAVVLALFVGAQLLASPSGGLGGPPSVEPTVEPTTTPEPSVPEPTSSAGASLPEGPILIWDPTREEPDSQAPTITVTISAQGWQFHEDYQYLQKGPGDEDNEIRGDIVWPGSVPPGTGLYVYGNPCQWSSTRPETPATTVDEIVAAIAAQADRDASDPLDVTIDGYAGKTITLHVPDDVAPDFADCDDQTFVTYEIADGGQPPAAQGPGQIDQYWILDVEGSIVFIDAWYYPDTTDETVEEMQAIVESATFELP